MRTTIKSTSASARCYPSVNGTSRRLWPAEDVVGIDGQGRACLRSEGWFPKTTLKVGDTIETLDMLYCDLNNLDKTKLEEASFYSSVTSTLTYYYVLARFTCAKSGGGVYPYGALVIRESDNHPYMLFFDNNTDTSAQKVSVCTNFSQNKYGWCTFIPLNAHNAPYKINKDCGGLAQISQVKQMAGVKDGLVVKKTTTYYYDTSASSLEKTLFEIRVDGITTHTIKWTGTKLTDNDTDIAVKKDGFVHIFNLDAEGTIASALA